VHTVKHKQRMNTHIPTGTRGHLSLRVWTGNEYHYLWALAVPTPPPSTICKVFPLCRHYHAYTQRKVFIG